MDRTALFKTHRARLQSLAYRMVGSMSEAEDIVQEASLRWFQSDTAEVRSAEAWLVSTTTRLCIDRFRRLAVERSYYVGQWLPEPFIGGLTERPDHQLELASDLSMAFLVVLERLVPDERAVFILHDVFDWDFSEIAAILSKSEAACRQIAHRARERVREDRPRFQVSPGAKKRLLIKFLAAMEAGDTASLMTVLADGAILRSDGGGKVKVSPRSIQGAERIARLIHHTHFLPRYLREKKQSVFRQVTTVNGEPGIVTFYEDKPISTLSVETDGRQVLAIYQIFNPEKLTHIQMPPGGAAKHRGTVRDQKKPN